MPWSRTQMAERLARELQDGWIVNLGVGIPTLITDVDVGEKDITFHAENGVIGFGPVASQGQEDIHLVDASRRYVTLPPGAAIVDHADSFGLIRSGRIDVTILGCYEAAANRDFANWKVKGSKGGVIGGAMDLAACAKHVFLMMEHRTRDGSPRLLKECSLPITAPKVVNLVITELGLFEPTGTAFKLRDLAPGVTLDEVRAATAAPVEA